MCIREFLRARAVRFELLLHRPVSSAAHLAGSVHVPGRRVAKSVLFRAGDRFGLAVLPATHRVDTARLAEILGLEEVRIATSDEVERIFADCEPGALPPFGHLYGLPTILDASLAGGAEIVFVANTRHECVRMRFRDFEAIEAPTRARFASPIATRRTRKAS
jgi:Ala-tRNA(Pro) deacylase